MIHTEPTPGQEGSAEAVSILLLLHRHGEMSAGDIAQLLGLERSDIVPALLGLRERHRIALIDGHGMAARWKVAGVATPRQTERTT